MIEIWAEWTNGQHDKIDEFTCVAEAVSMLFEYQLAYYMNGICYLKTSKGEKVCGTSLL
jgi:hypothetical protein